MEGTGEGEWLPLAAIRSAYPGSIVYPPGGTHGPRLQGDVQIVVLHTGSIRLAVDDDVRDIAAGTMVLLTPGRREHFAFSETEDSWHTWVTLVTDPLPPEAMRRLAELPPMLPAAETMNRLIGVMLACRDGRAPDDGPLLRTLALSALQLYAAESSARADPRGGVHRAVTLAKDAIRWRYAEELRLCDLADAAHVSPEHLIRLFRQYEGVSPMHYLWRFRVERSGELLRGTGLGVQEVALASGFKNGHHFARLFRRTTGMTPTEYRSGFVRKPPVTT
ncbi:AraC family transcriptional regulator [Paenibacillus flagellatus]|nr:AraC family transcriptional regulator [Paenibacillus flagellatus]